MSYTLKYLFQAEFNDGSMYKQNAEDTPQLGTVGSAFTDIKDWLDDIKSFRLLDLEDNVICSVNLNDGSFDVKGQAINVQDPSVNLPQDVKYRLIYFRRVKHSRDTSGQVWLHPVDYHVGWQCTHEAKNYQQTISVTGQ